MTNTNHHPENITWRQITTMTKMACGAKQPVTFDDNGLRFKVGGRQRWIEVELDASDTYTARLVRMTRNYQRVTVEESAGVYVDCLNETIYHMVNK